MKLWPKYKTNEGRKVILCTNEDGEHYLKVISCFGISTAYTMEGNLIGRWEATETEKNEYLNATEYTDTKEEEEETMERTEAIKQEIENTKARSAWSKGVKVYAYELAEQLEEGIHGGWYYEDDLDAPKVLEKMLLNGAQDWKQYSWGGSALIYDGDIAERLCSPSELTKTRHGQRRPNKSEEWLDTQARALYQASRLVREAVERTRATA